MTTPQTPEQHAESILREIAGDDYLPECSCGLCHNDALPAILTALTAYGVACAEAMREAAAREAFTPETRHPKHCCCESCILNQTERDILALDPAAIIKIIKGMGHG